MIYYTYYNSPIGKILIKSDGQSLKVLALEGQSNYKILELEQYVDSKQIPVFEKVTAYLQCYFNANKPEINDIPLSPDGNSFRQTVWQILKAIPYGKTITYGEIAKKLVSKYGYNKMSAQAVGNAVKNNPISILIPCHRVLGKNNALVGYNGGTHYKALLLSIEKATFKP